MFDVTPDEIAGLNDEDLRTLVALLCEAEASLRGLPRSAVTWGGNQTAPDGGLDVRVSLRQDAPVEGFIPRFSTGIQVKKPDMRPRDIIREMRPAGLIRPVIQELADEGGTYLIISSGASTSDRALRERCSAMREALADVANAERLHVEFYDRTRLATAVRSHPGLVTWVKERAGRSLVHGAEFRTTSTFLTISSASGSEIGLVTLDCLLSKASIDYAEISRRQETLSGSWAYPELVRPD
jgi:hypothetical protein